MSHRGRCLLRHKCIMRIYACPQLHGFLRSRLQLPGMGQHMLRHSCSGHAQPAVSQCGEAGPGTWDTCTITQLFSCCSAQLSSGCKQWWHLLSSSLIVVACIRLCAAVCTKAIAAHNPDSNGVSYGLSTAAGSAEIHRLQSWV